MRPGHCRTDRKDAGRVPTLPGGVDTDVGLADILRTWGTAVLRPYVTLLRTKL